MEIFLRYGSRIVVEGEKGVVDDSSLVFVEFAAWYLKCLYLVTSSSVVKDGRLIVIASEIC